MKIHSSTGTLDRTLFLFHFCIFCWQLFYFKNCTFRILAYANILTINIFCSPRSLTDAVWVWEELGTSCEGCRLPWSHRCLLSTVESHPSRPAFLQGFFRSVPFRNKCFIFQFIEEWFLPFPSVSVSSRTQHVSDIQRYGVYFHVDGDSMNENPSDSTVSI